MKRARRFLSALLLACLAVVRAGEPDTIELRSLSPEGEFEYDEATGVATSPAGVEIRYGDARLTARQVRFDRTSGEVLAEGDVRLERGAELWAAEQLRYNFLTRTLDTASFRAGVRPFFTGGEGLAGSLTNQTHSATNAFVTTDDFSSPAYRVRARQLTFVPGRYLEARGATLLLGKVPVFYLPRYRHYLDRNPNGFEVKPGYRSLYGPYLLSAYNWSPTTNLETSVRLDLRQKRGVGTGLDLRSQLGGAGTNDLSTYFTYDFEPGTNALGQDLNPHRWRVRYGHTAFLRTNLTFRGQLNAQSDEFVVRDFFERQYRENPQPQSFANLNQRWSNFTLDVLAQGQLFDFYETVERLPDLQLTGTRQQLGVSPFYYESESSAAYLRRRFAYDTQPHYAALRADTYHQLLLPQTFFGWLNVTPRVGGRFTWYGEQEGAGTVLEAQDRWVFNTGAEVSTKAARLWRGVENRLFDVHGLRHIVEPSVNYVFVPDPSVEPPRLPQFDYELNSFRLLPVDYPDYVAIDAINAQNALRFGLRNRLQTMRAGALENLVNWDLLLDWRLDPRPDQRTYGDLYSALEFRPRSWLLLSSELRYDINETTLRLAYSTLSLEPNDRWSWRLAHRYFTGWPGEGPESGNNLFINSVRFKLNENWSLRAVHYFEARDGNLDEQFYVVQRDFRSWTGALVFRLRNPRGGDEDYTIGAMISLKPFPRYSLNSDRDFHHSLFD
jgi:lipopolysaccharide assembly outer membrane protein LptD (OstA)